MKQSETAADLAELFKKDHPYVPDPIILSHSLLCPICKHVTDLNVGHIESRNKTYVFQTNGFRLWAFESDGIYCRNSTCRSWISLPFGLKEND